MIYLLAFYATIVTGVCIVSLLVNYALVKKLPEVGFNVAMTAIDTAIDTHAPFLKEIREGNRSGGGRPPEGGLLGQLMQFASTPMGQNLINRFSGSGSKSTYNPGIR